MTGGFRGWTKPQVLLCRIVIDDQPEPRRRERDAAQIQMAALLGLRRRRDLPPQQQDADDDDRLRGEHVTPGELRGHVPADQGPDRHGHGGDPAEQRVGECPVLALVAGGRERRDRGDDHDRPEALHARPPDQQHPEVRAEGREQRSNAVDRQPDGERLPPTEDVAELRPHQHERGHDQRVQRDRRLHPLDGGVQILDDLRDRDVHHARVEHHHELGRRQHREGNPFAHVKSPYWVGLGRPTAWIARRSA